MRTSYRNILAKHIEPASQTTPHWVTCTDSSFPDMSMHSAGAVARPSADIVTPAAGRHLTQASGNQGTISENPVGPSQTACTAQGLACCYSPTW